MELTAESLAALDERFETSRTIDFVESLGCQRIALQLPDELLPLAPALAARLQQLSSSRQSNAASTPTRRFAVLGDTSYGACCVDEVNAAHMSADAVIHYGHACLSAPASLPVLYVFDRLPVDVPALAATVAEAVTAARAASSSESGREAVLLLWEPGYVHALPAVLAAVGKQLAAAASGPASSDSGAESSSAASGSSAESGSSAAGLHEPVRLASPCPDELIVPHFWRASVPAAARSRIAAAASSASSAAAAGSCACSGERAQSADAGAHALAAADASAGGSSCSRSADTSAAASSTGSGCCRSAATSTASGCCQSAAVPSSGCCGGSGSGAAAAEGGAPASDRCGSGGCACSAKLAGAATGGAGAGAGAGTGEAAPPAPGQTAVSKASDTSSSGVRAQQHVCCGLHYVLPLGMADHSHARIRVLHVGVRPPRMRAVMLTYAAAAGLTFVDPAPAAAPAASAAGSAAAASDAAAAHAAAGPARPLPTVSVAAQVRRQINAAYMHVEAIRKARTIGIVAGTLAVAGRNEIIAALRAGAKAAGKAAYVLVVGKLTVAKLGNFPDIDAFVLVACPEQALLDVETTRAHAKPVVTPHEALVALTSIAAARAGGADSDDDGGSAEGGLSWAGAGELDFERLVRRVKGLTLSAFAAPEGGSGAGKGDGPSRSRRRKAGAAGCGGGGKADFSTEGQFSDDDDDEEGDDADEAEAAAAAAAAETALVRRADADSALSTAVFTSAAATYLQQKRTWRGLQYDYDADAAVETASVARPLPASASGAGASGGTGAADASGSALVLVGSATAEGGALAAGGAGARHNFDTRIREGLTGIASRYEKEHGSETVFAGKPVIASTAARE